MLFSVFFQKFCCLAFCIRSRCLELSFVRGEAAGQSCLSSGEQASGVRAEEHDRVLCCESCAESATVVGALRSLEAKASRVLQTAGRWVVMASLSG